MERTAAGKRGFCPENGVGMYVCMYVLSTLQPHHVWCTDVSGGEVRVKVRRYWRGDGTIWCNHDSGKYRKESSGSTLVLVSGCGGSKSSDFRISVFFVFG